MNEIVIYVMEKTYDGLRPQGQCNIAHLMPPIWSQPKTATLSLDQVQAILSVAYAGMQNIKVKADLSTVVDQPSEVHSVNGEQA